MIYNKIVSECDKMNVSNKLKNKVIRHDDITDDEISLFFRYLINKTMVITNNMYYRKNFNPMYLFDEICYSYNLKTKLFVRDDGYIYVIVDINNKKYLVDINFYDKNIEDLSVNKYIEYTDDNMEEYLRVIGKKDNCE